MREHAPMVDVRDLSYSYSPGGPEALRDLSLGIERGSLAAVLGPNGSGKTTLLNVLLGWLSPSAGRVELAGAPSDSYSRRQLSRLVGLVPQHEHFAFDLRVLEYVLLGRAPYLSILDLPGDEDRGIAQAALSAVGITHLGSRSVASLSGGERQLATLARAIAQDPDILLLDEPMSHLDIGNTRRLLNALVAMRDRGKTVVFTTHDPNAAAASADKVILLKEGRLIAEGPPAATLNAPNLSALYGVDVQVIVNGDRPVIIAH